MGSQVGNFVGANVEDGVGSEEGRAEEIVVGTDERDGVASKDGIDVG